MLLVFEYPGTEKGDGHFKGIKLAPPKT